MSEKITRRAALATTARAALAVAAGSGVAVAAAPARPASPHLALTRSTRPSAHQEADQAFVETYRGEPPFSEEQAYETWSSRQRNAGDAVFDAAWAILDVEPTTIAGTLAFLDYVTRYSANGYRDWPQREPEADDTGGRRISFEDDAMRFVSRSLKRLFPAGSSAVPVSAGLALTAATAGESRLMELLRDAKVYTDKISALYALPPETDIPDEWLDPLYDALRPIEEQIIATKSRTVAEMRAKAELMMWCHAEYPADDREELAMSERLQLSIARDLLSV